MNYEKGTRNPDAYYLATLAAIGIDVLYLLTGERTPVQRESLSVAELVVLENMQKLPEEERHTMARISFAMASPYIKRNKDTEGDLDYFFKKSD